MKNIKNLMKKETLIIVLIVVLLSGGYYIQQRGSADDKFSSGLDFIERKNDISEESAIEINPSTSNTILVSDQTSGNKVQIDSINISEKLWVVVYEEKEGSRGNILGATRFRPENTNGEISLLRGTIPESRYQVVLHTDDGDDVFNHITDTPLTVQAQNGEVSEIIATFNTTPQP